MPPNHAPVIQPQNILWQQSACVNRLPKSPSCIDRIQKPTDVI